MTLSEGQIVTVRTASGPRKGRVVKATARGASVKFWVKGAKPPRLAQSATTVAAGDILAVNPPRTAKKSRKTRRNPAPGVAPVQVGAHSRQSPKRSGTSKRSSTSKRSGTSKRSTPVQQGLPLHPARKNPGGPGRELWPTDVKAGEWVVCYAVPVKGKLARRRDKLFATKADAIAFLNAQPAGRALLMQIRDVYGE